MMLSCKVAKSYELIIVGRFIVGVQCGLFTGLTPLYLAEISPAHTRGAVGVFHQLALVIGILTAQVLGFPILLGTNKLWNLLLGLTALPSLIQATILPFCPESPRFLLTTCENEKACRESLEILRGTSNVDEEMDLLTSEKDSESMEVAPLSISQLLCDPSLRQPLLIGVVLHLSQQVNGIPGVFFYSTRLFRDAGISENTAKYMTSALGVVMVTMGVLTVPLMDRTGRRTLMLLGLGGMAIAGTLVTVTLSLREVVDGFNVVSIVLILVFVVFFALGPAPVPWLMAPELFTHDARPAAVSICVLVNWLGSFWVSFAFPWMQIYLKDFVFLPFIMMLVLFFLFTYFKVPETKGKSFREISILMETFDSECPNIGGSDGYMDDAQASTSGRGSKFRAIEKFDPSESQLFGPRDKIKDGVGGDGYGTIGNKNNDVVLFERVS